MVKTEDTKDVFILAPRKLTPTERRIVAYVGERQGVTCAKAQIAEALGKNPKTVSRLISRLRADGLLITEPTYDESGAQRANSYRLGPGWSNLHARS